MNGFTLRMGNHSGPSALTLAEVKKLTAQAIQKKSITVHADRIQVDAEVLHKSKKRSRDRHRRSGRHRHGRSSKSSSGRSSSKSSSRSSRSSSRSSSSATHAAQDSAAPSASSRNHDFGDDVLMSAVLQGLQDESLTLGGPAPQDPPD